MPPSRFSLSASPNVEHPFVPMAAHASGVPATPRPQDSRASAQASFEQRMIAVVLSQGAGFFSCPDSNSSA
eukprot:CAMPEP_0173379874 /NCGR_PEP_ID=MMETSP1356-20130122/2679_1 /TAXON_ID=77927 ORGANISM="Hemiselmis virescens, Strain PCC157" /NCGR_SAMPLE_ID=MMETSP1356 /ASSEMBLY_ACC=CAM_ASM_000847 /LENGTH=70 /DNA_ID=CAMNT_0014333301 /DNA_START=607 /DNA_END=819 /DNA_ORIENTATION=+